MQNTSDRKVLVTGATGFIGRALVPALRARGCPVVAASRRPMTSTIDAASVEWRTCDLLRPETLPTALRDIKVAYYLVHSMGGGHADFRELERRAAEAFVAASAKAGVERIVYLGGPAPRGHPSEHLRSRLQVGEILRAGPVSTVELRASMVIGTGGASWRIVRDLALRLPAMVMPRWLKSRTRPIALDDVVVALVADEVHRRSGRRHAAVRLRADAFPLDERAEHLHQERIVLVLPVVADLVAEQAGAHEQANATRRPRESGAPRRSQCHLVGVTRDRQTRQRTIDHVVVSEVPGGPMNGGLALGTALIPRATQ